MNELEKLKLEMEVLKVKNQTLEEELNQIHEQRIDIYSQVNKLLLWKGSLKVKINEACSNLNLIGKDGYLADMFPDGCTIFCQEDDNFYRIPADWLDIIEWDEEKFQSVLKNYGYSKINGLYIHESQIKKA